MEEHKFDLLSQMRMERIHKMERIDDDPNYIEEFNKDFDIIKKLNKKKDIAYKGGVK